MIKEYVDAWFRNRDKLKKYFETHTQGGVKYIMLQTRINTRFLGIY